MKHDDTELMMMMMMMMGGLAPDSATGFDWLHSTVSSDR